MAGHDAVLFDLDGVLVDSRVPFARSVNSALAAHGLPPRPERDLHQYLGPPLHLAFRELVSDESLVQPCVDAYRVRYREMAASETSVFPGIREILDSLSAQLPFVVATSKPWIFVMVGDRKHDITAAREHGIRAIGVLWGVGTKEELLAAGADALAHAPAELAVLLAPTACEPDRDSVSR